MDDSTSTLLPVNGESGLNVLLKLSSHVVRGQICLQLPNEMAWLPNNLTHEVSPRPSLLRNLTSCYASSCLVAQQGNSCATVQNIYTTTSTILNPHEINVFAIHYTHSRCLTPNSTLVCKHPHTATCIPTHTFSHPPYLSRCPPNLLFAYISHHAIYPLIYH